MTSERATTSTITAIATGPVAAGVGMVRISGPLALAAARRVVPALPEKPVARHAYFCRVVDSEGEPLDDALVLHFPAPHSFTGEDVVEVQTHGAPALLKLVINQLISNGDVRIAEPGEFTRRAYLNGRIDLARAEGVLALLQAESDAGVRAAAQQLTGAFSKRLEAVRRPLVDLSADLEAALDFPDESDDDTSALAARLTQGLTQLQALMRDSTAGALLRKGAKLVLYGPVNAGKSTLFNRLLGAERALVDDQPGTTRDVLESVIELGGMRVTVSDTAGFREGPERLEALGIGRARAELEAADLAVLLVPPQADPEAVESWRREVPDERRLEVLGKADQLISASERSTWNMPGVSGLTGAGVDALRALIIERLSARLAASVAVASSRHVEALTRAVDALQRANDAMTSGTLELVAGEVTQCLSALGEITGEDATADVIDALFQRFCIGK